MPKLTKNSRKHDRVRATYLLKYQTGDSSYARVTNVKDVSAGGLCFLTNECLLPGSLIRLAILIPSFDRPVEAKARVVRVARIKRNRMAFSVAVNFVDITDSAHNTMRKFVEALSRAKKRALFVDLPEIVMRQR